MIPSGGMREPARLPGAPREFIVRAAAGPARSPTLGCFVRTCNSVKTVRLPRGVFRLIKNSRRLTPSSASITAPTAARGRCLMYYFFPPQPDTTISSTPCVRALDSRPDQKTASVSIRSIGERALSNLGLTCDGGRVVWGGTFHSPTRSIGVLGRQHQSASRIIDFSVRVSIGRRRFSSASFPRRAHLVLFGVKAPDADGRKCCASSFALLSGAEISTAPRPTNCGTSPRCRCGDCRHHR